MSLSGGPNAVERETAGDGRRTELRRQFAWDWFEYHAAQRLRAFHFFLISTGLAAVVFAQAIEQRLEGLAVATAGAGLCLAVGFLFLDRRNAELVDRGEAALQEIQKELELSLLEESSDSPAYIRHSFVLRGIELVAATLWIAGGTWAIAGLPAVG